MNLNAKWVYWAGWTMTGLIVVAMVLDAGIASRHVRGDLFTRDSTRTRLLRTQRKDFYGPEVVLTMQINQIRSSLAYYYMNGAVDGFSKGQVVAGVSISARLGGGEFSRGGP